MGISVIPTTTTTTIPTLAPDRNHTRRLQLLPVHMVRVPRRRTFFGTLMTSKTPRYEAAVKYTLPKTFGHCTSTGSSPGRGVASKYPATAQRIAPSRKKTEIQYLAGEDGRAH